MNSKNINISSSVYQKLFAFVCVLVLTAISYNVQAQSRSEETPAHPSPETHMTAAKWDLFNDQIIRALGSGHAGLQEGALRMIIKYGDRLDMDRAKNDLVHLYRSAESENLRRMAVVALGSLNEDWAINNLRRYAEEESSPAVRQTIQAVIVQDYLSKQNIDGAEELVVQPDASEQSQ